MMTKNKRQLNNAGASLVLVLVCMLFVGIIASTILVLTTNNLESSRTGTKVTATFYSAEEAADKVRAVLQEFADGATNAAYTKWLQQYSIGERNVGAVFDGLFADEMLIALEKNLAATPAGGGEAAPLVPTKTVVTDEATGAVLKTTYRVDIAEVKTLNDLIGPDTNGGTVTWVNSELVMEIESNTLRLKDIAIEYIDTEGVRTTITTDVVFTAKSPTFTVNTVKGQNMNAAEFALIANGSIMNDGFAMNGNKVTSVGNPIQFNVKGNLYGGTRIALGNGTLNTFGEVTVTRGDIVVSDNAVATFKGISSALGFTNATKLWAKNILLTNTGSGVRSGGRIDLFGSAFLADDLTLGNYSQFALQGSNCSFYGYNTNNAASYRDHSIYSSEYSVGTPDGSSAIIINGNNATLDLSAANTAWIAGKAFVNVSSVAGSVNSSSDKTFMEGESVAYKGQQAAYLVPGECIMGIGHNPMTMDEFKTLIKDTELATIGSTMFTPDKIEPGKIQLDRAKVSISSYVDPTIPYRPAFIIYGGKNLVYLYLNFKNADLAASYFQDYENVYGDLVQGRMSAFGTGTIKMPASIVNTGNILAYESASTTLGAKNTSYTDSAIINKQIELSSKFSGMYSGLSESYAGTNARVTDSIVDLSVVSAPGSSITIKDDEGNVQFTHAIADTITINGAYSGVSGSFSFAQGAQNDVHGNAFEDLSTTLYTKYPDLAHYTLFLARGNVNISSNGGATDCGIIICGGNVIIDAGASFKGMIICGGDVIVKGNSTVTSDPRMVSTIIKNSRVMNELFLLNETSGTAQGGGANTVATSGLITIDFENWRKN